MKDKRQRVAMTWAYDPNVYAYLVNAAFSQYPYAAAAAAAAAGTLSPPHHKPQPQTLPPQPFNYYASVGLQRAAAAAYGSMGPLRGPPPGLVPGGHPESLPYPPSSLTCGLLMRGGGIEPPAHPHAGPFFPHMVSPTSQHSSRDVRPASLFAGAGHVPGVCSAGVSGDSGCACHLMLGAGPAPALFAPPSRPSHGQAPPPLARSEASVTSPLRVTSSKRERKSPKADSLTSTTSLFQPYRIDS